MITIANAPCSWGVLEFDIPQESAGYPQVLNEMAAAGYVGTELGDWGFMPTEPNLLREELAARNLQMLGAFVPVDLRHEAAHEGGVAAALRTARLLAAVGDTTKPFIVLADENGKDPTRVALAGRIGLEHGMSAEQWRTFAEGCELIARAVLEETGLPTVFHHHCAGFVETPAEVERLLELTDPALLGLCFDTGHYTYGGGDALNGLVRHRDRIWHVHFKDYQPAAAGSDDAPRDYFAAVRHGVFCELGRGVVDFPAVVAELRQRGYGGAIVVEQDVLPGMGTPLASARRNRDYLASLGL